MGILLMGSDVGDKLLYKKLVDILVLGIQIEAGLAQDLSIYT
jgi:hypothetical protein